ncbi:MAG: phosphatase PAP2 family protein, partial [Gemmatimonadales bacterium]
MMRPERSARYGILLLVAFAVVAILALGGHLMRWDVAILRWVAAQRTPARTDVMRDFSAVGEWYWEVPAAFAMAGIIWICRHQGDAWRFLVLGISTEIVYAAAKAAFHRPRPTVVSHLGKAGWYSFPSGHAMLALTIWGFGLWLLADLAPRRESRILIRTVGLTLAVAIAGSRIYLGV